jgi:hypothetical protein
MRREVFLFLVLLTGILSCKKEYKDLQRISESAYNYLPFVPGDTLIFINEGKDSLKFYAPVNQQTLYFINTQNGNCENCGLPSNVTREIYRSECLQKGSGSQLKMCANLDIDDEPITGYEFDVLTIMIQIDGSENGMILMTEKPENWLDDYTKNYNGFPHLSFNYDDTIQIINKEFYNVFSKKGYDPKVYYSYEKGFIAIKYQNQFWINEKYR